MKFGQALLCVIPETLQAIDINPARGETFSMINPQMSVTAEHQRIVASEFIRRELKGTDLFS